MPIQFLVLFLALPTSIPISSSNFEDFFFFFCNSNTCPLETGWGPLSSCQMVTVMFIDSIHRSASMVHKVPKSYIARHLVTGRVSVSLALCLALKVLFVHAMLVLFLNCYLPHFCPQSCSSNFWLLTLCQDSGQTGRGKESFLAFSYPYLFLLSSPCDSIWPNAIKQAYVIFRR